MYEYKLKMDLADVIAIQSLLGSYIKLMKMTEEHDPFMKNMKDSQIFCCDYLINKIEGKLEKLK